MNGSGVVLINAQQESEKRWILQNELAHNGGVSVSSQTRDSPSGGLLVKLFEGDLPHTLSYSDQNPIGAHQILCSRSH